MRDFDEIIDAHREEPFGIIDGDARWDGDPGNIAEDIRRTAEAMMRDTGYRRSDTFMGRVLGIFPGDVDLSKDEIKVKLSSNTRKIAPFVKRKTTEEAREVPGGGITEVQVDPDFQTWVTRTYFNDDGTTTQTHHRVL